MKNKRPSSRRQAQNPNTIIKENPKMSMVEMVPYRQKTLPVERNRLHHMTIMKRYRRALAELSALKLIINGLADELGVEWDGSVGAAKSMHMRLRSALEKEACLNAQ
ncbi:hypothetical protein [Desulfofundulus thermocisternus]|uniref:hypothetical protein n=1 Tax=Desulfofundulus thermocisternus TaxID=42471 RepID=UPI00217D45BB|nr:hypothetical protein [Desulfofundulus thermocisternus]MCS5696972.1 hypothetical protein [Desulfofundulus thermocisternus]